MSTYVDSVSVPDTVRDAVGRVLIDGDEILGEEVAADFVEMKVASLRAMRAQGRGPRFFKPSKQVYYLKSDLAAWILAAEGE